MPQMSRLLVVACSASKRPFPRLMPAIERYNGPVFQVVRKYLRESPREPLHVMILSAKYGLITADQEITDYDCRVSRVSAERLHPQVLQVASRVLSSREWQSVGICAGKDYRVALAGVAELVPLGVRFDFIEGGQGPRLTALKKWLLQST